MIMIIGWAEFSQMSKIVWTPLNLFLFCIKRVELYFVDLENER